MSAPTPTPNLDLSGGMVSQASVSQASGTPSSSSSSSSQPSPSPSGSSPNPATAGGVDLSGGMVAQADSSDPGQSGEFTNDEGTTFIVPKDGEEFPDTLKRAVARWKGLSPEQRQDQMSRETSHPAAKAAKTLAVAAGLGLAGPAALAGAGEAGAAIPSVLAHTTAGVKAIGTWAAANPVQAYIVYNLLKELVPGAKKAMGIVKASPEAGGE